MVTSTGVDSLATSAVPATKSKIGSSILLTLGAGSGINVEELAENLTNVEKLPAESALQRKIDKVDAKISGYGLISSQLDILASSFEKINDANEIYSTAGKSDNEKAVSFLSVTNAASEGGYDINVYQLAENQRIASNSYQTNSGNVNGGTAFDITLSIGATRTGTYDHSITTAQLQAIGDDASAVINYSDGTNTIKITQAEIDAAMESLEGAGTYTFGNATLEGLILAINNDIAANSGFAANFSSAQVHYTKGISFVQTIAGASVSLAQPTAGSGSPASNLGSVSEGINSGTNSGSSVTDTVIQIGAGDDTLAGIVAAINEADTGITAALLDVGGIGNNYRIILSGAEGLDGSFSVATSSANATASLGFNKAENVLQGAQDAQIGYQGLLVNRGSNVITDLIEGVTFQINATTGQQSSVPYQVLANGSGGDSGTTYLTKYRTETVFDSARLTITRDNSQLKTNLREIVSSYNDLEDLIDELNTDEAVEAGLSLAGEGSLLRSVQSRIYNALTASSSSASGTVDAVRDLGISVDRYGKLQFDEAKYDSLITTNWDDVVTMLTADTTNQNLHSETPKGLSQDVATIINGLSASAEDGDVSNGLIANRIQTLSKSEESYQNELTKLEVRMTALYQRYLTEFTLMETLMSSLNNTRDYMKGQLDVITSAYDKN